MRRQNRSSLSLSLADADARNKLAGGPAPTGECAAGFYCSGSALVAAPQDGTSGAACGPGTYCAPGSSQPTPCPAGTYSNYSQAAECLPCAPGAYCAGIGLVEPSGPCDAGYYCRGGAATPAPSGALCPAGYACAEGASEPAACAPGTYAPSPGAEACAPCPEAHFCASNTSALDATTSCPRGFACPENTTHATAHPCPPGTYGADGGLASLDDCAACPPGKYCARCVLNGKPESVLLSLSLSR